MSVCLTIRDIERLAAAGVKIELNNVDPMPDPEIYVQAAPLQQVMRMQTKADAIWDRWHRSREARNTGARPYYRDEVHPLPYDLLASQHGDKVWVSVHPTNFNYEPFQITDDAAIYPSDALMAQLALWEANHK